MPHDLGMLYLQIAEHLGSCGLEVELHGKFEVVIDGVEAGRDRQQAIVVTLLQEDAQ